jgi:uncharacterized membrane protein YecN with MAPEG domain
MGERVLFVTPLYAGLLALWFLVLSWRVIQRRGKGTYLGDGGDQALLRVIRGHANFAEYVPLALLMMGFLEVSRYSIYVLHALGIVLLVARLLHGYALSFTEHFSFGRFWGSALTFIVLGIEAVLCIYQGILGQWIWCCAR